MLPYSSALLSVALTAWCPEAMPTDTLPFLLPAILPAFISQSTHHFYVLYEHSTPSWHLKTFPHPLRNTLHTYIYQNCAPQYYLYFLLKEATSDPQCYSAYINAEIFICIHIFPLPSPGQSQKRTLFCTLRFAIFMRARDVPMQGKHNDSSRSQTHTHTPDATHRPKNWNETLRGREEVCVLRKRNCGGCCGNRGNSCRYLKDLLGREFIESNLHLHSWRVRKGE